MPLAKRFKLGSCFGGGAVPDTPAEPKKEEKEEEEEVAKPYDFSKHTEHTVWRLAVAAAEGTKHCPTYEDALIPWSHPTAEEGSTSEVCTLAPVGGPGLATLFLRTTLSASGLAQKINVDFFEDKLTVKVSPVHRITGDSYPPPSFSACARGPRRSATYDIPRCPDVKAAPLFGHVFAWLALFGEINSTWNIFFEERGGILCRLGVGRMLCRFVVYARLCRQGRNSARYNK